MSNSDIPKCQRFKRLFSNTTESSSSSTSLSLSPSDSSVNKKRRTLFYSDDDCTAITRSTSADVDIACPKTTAKHGSCSRSGPDPTALSADIDLDTPTTAPRLDSVSDTIGLAERQIVTPTVLHMAIPHIRSVAEYAKDVAGKVFQSLEQFIDSKSQQADSSYDPLRKLVQDRSIVATEDLTPRFTHEKHLYISIDALVRFIENATVDMATPHNGGHTRPRKFGTYISKPPALESDELCEWPNAAITYRDKRSLCFSGRTDHWNTLALIEARRSDEEQADALEHLTIYAWNLYAYRLDHKFVWGFTVCDSSFHACLYSQDNVFVSDAMDVATAEGRMDLVSLLVNMSFCDAGQLGYDTTIRYNSAVSAWEIDVYDDERNTTDIYWIDMVYPFDATIFGNQTRIIRCLRPNPSARSDVDSGESNYICVKDSWTSCNHLASVRDRDEVYALRRITKELESDVELEGSFPKLLSGGVVRQKKTPDSSPSPESTETLLAALGDDVLKGVSKRVHRRLAATPFALPISHLRSVDELIVVVADVMTTYMAIAQRCGILHRDISENNIMFTRKPDGSVRGVLVDFDSAMPVEDSVLESWKPDMRGTLPFMSFGNLTISPLRRTILDDWESLIYVLCWICTFGFSEECGFQSQSDTDPSSIIQWQSRGSKWAADEKRALLTSITLLSSVILQQRISESSYDVLEGLIYDLFGAIFQNKRLTLMAHGACTPSTRTYPDIMKCVRKKLKKISKFGKPQLWDHDIDWNIVDPFERRQIFKEKIAKQLLNVVHIAKAEALGRLAKNS